MKKRYKNMKFFVLASYHWEYPKERTEVCCKLLPLESQRLSMKFTSALLFLLLVLTLQCLLVDEVSAVGPGRHGCRTCERNRRVKGHRSQPVFVRRLINQLRFISQVSFNLNCYYRSIKVRLIKVIVLKLYCLNFNV